MTPEARQWFEAGGSEPGVLTPEATAALVRTEYVRWGRLIRDLGLKAE